MTETKYRLYETTYSEGAEPVFLGAGTDLDAMTNDAARLVSGRRYQKLHIEDEGGNVLIRVYRRNGDTWVASNFNTVRSSKATDEVIAGMDQLEIPGVDWSQY